MAWLGPALPCLAALAFTLAFCAPTRSRTLSTSSPLPRHSHPWTASTPVHRRCHFGRCGVIIEAGALEAPTVGVCAAVIVDHDDPEGDTHHGRWLVSMGSLSSGCAGCGNAVSMLVG